MTEVRFVTASPTGGPHRGAPPQDPNSQQAELRLGAANGGLRASGPPPPTSLHTRPSLNVRPGRGAAPQGSRAPLAEPKVTNGEGRVPTHQRPLARALSRARRVNVFQYFGKGG